MQRIVILLLGMASLVASGVILDRGRVGLNSNIGLGVQTIQGIRGGLGGHSLTGDELLRQKFILDILQQVYQPLQQQDLLALDDRNTVTNEDLYQRPLTQEMLMVLDLIRNNQMLVKQNICSIGNEHHMRQMVGLYRLLVNARDFDTFKCLVVHARQNINTEMFVNALVLALGERSDTQMLIVPALYEILPQLYHQDHVIDQVRQLDTGVSSINPQLVDVMGTGHQNRLWNTGISGQQTGLLGVLNRSQLWLPWRQMHRQMAYRKMMGGNVVQQDEKQLDKLVVSLPGNGLLSQDLDLKAYVNILVDELIVSQDIVRNSNRNQIGVSGQQWNVDSTYGGIRRNHGDDYNINSQRYNIFGIRRDNTVGGFNDIGVTDELNRNRFGGHRVGYDIDEINRNRNIYEENKYGINIDTENAMDRNRVMMGGRRFGNERDVQFGYHNIQEGQRGINTVSANDARLLFVGRRRKNPNTVVTLGQNNYDNYVNYDNDDMISGGRHVSNDNKYDNDKRQRSKHGNDYDDDTFRNINVNRRGMIMDNNDDDLSWNYVNSQNTPWNTNRQTDDDFLFNRNRADWNDVNVNNRDNWNRNRDDDSNWNLNRRFNVNSRDRTGQTDDYAENTRNSYVGTGRGRSDFLNIVTRGQKQSWNDDQDVIWNRGNVGRYSGESLDKNLPTTNINDERLLYVNRRRLNNIEEGGSVNNRYDTDRWQSANQRGSVGGSRWDDQTNWQHRNMDINRQGYQNTWQYNDNDFGNNRFQNRARDSSNGHRYRRSLDNQYQDIDNQDTNTGKLLLHTLQQLVARLNVERIALGQPQLIDETQHGSVRGLLSSNMAISRNLDVHAINKIEEIIERVDQVLQQQINEISLVSYNQKVNDIGLLLAGQIQEIGLLHTLDEIIQQGSFQQQQRKGHVANIISQEAVQILLAGIVKVVDQNVQQVYRQREEFTFTPQGVNINQVKVDHLQTHLEYADIDLSNLVRHDLQQTIQGNSKQVVGRVPRLNHKDFNIDVDVTSERQQQVVVRNLLVPKIDGVGNIIPWNERRQNVIVLDIATVNLQPGHNHLKLRSNDITITARDTTPLTQIYQHVMQALNGNMVLQQDLLVGQSNMLPHHLLLPRGSTSGLPMQLITVITPVDHSAGVIGLHSGTFQNGWNTLLFDRLPFNYPLHCDISDVNSVNSLPNVMVNDVRIYHDDKIKMPHVHIL